MRGEWWTIFDDAHAQRLSKQQAAAANQNLKAAAARVKEARAINQTARAGLFPTIDAGFGPTRETCVAGVAVPAAIARTCRPQTILARAGERVV